jgi:hypothetical protein
MQAFAFLDLDGWSETKLKTQRTRSRIKHFQLKRFFKGLLDK